MEKIGKLVIPDYMVCYDVHRLIGYPFYYFGANQGIKANYFTLLAFFFVLFHVSFSYLKSMFLD